MVGEEKMTTLDRRLEGRALANQNCALSHRSALGILFPCGAACLAVASRPADICPSKDTHAVEACARDNGFFAWAVPCTKESQSGPSTPARGQTRVYYSVQTRVPLIL